MAQESTAATWDSPTQDWAGHGLIAILTKNVADMTCGPLWQFPELLARATAHELGHFIGKLGHSDAGLMSNNWSRKSLCRLPQEGLSFSIAEVRTLQKTLRQRMRR